ncbi:ATP synthase subunit delta, chloroplastic [Abrus precatorius]|uniref:ATP synthase subunit delta, chloroplastic n=1 Tax=Abrus precatorius TaxID=3816 RepID=A0A8B8L6N7_ABRPR|nr:ATP synthase subunit delta, chloroplastic [Abrus precatorius]
MDTLPTLKVPKLPSKFANPEFYHFKRTSYASPPPHVFSTSTPNLVPKTKSFSRKSSPSLAFSSSGASHPKPKPSSPIFHRNPATGYAAAIIDVAQNSNSLHLVQRDVQRLLKLLKNVNFQSAVGEPSMVERVVERGNFHRHVVALLKMLLKKNKVGIVQEVLEEFEKIYDELCGTQLVLVSSMTKMGQDELFGIAKKVQQLSGAMRVKVRNLVQENLPSFAV